MRRFVPSLLAVVLAGAGVLAGSAPVRAECPFFVIPPATEAAPSAREIIVGTVIENVRGLHSDFRLRIDHVLRGPAKVGEIRRFDRLWPDWPRIEMEDGTRIGPCEPIRAVEGNVIALSLDALAPDGVTRYNAESWLSGSLPYNFDEPRTTLAEMEVLASMNAPETDADPMPGARPAASPSALALLLAGAASLLALGALRRRWRETNG
jgi:hypothetical protein